MGKSAAPVDTFCKWCRCIGAREVIIMPPSNSHASTPKARAPGRASSLGPVNPELVSHPDLSSRVVDLTLGDVVDALVPYLPERRSNSANDSDAAIDRASAARWLGVSLAKLDGLIREDPTFPVHRVGEVRRFFVSELRAWVLAQNTTSRIK